MPDFIPDQARSQDHYQDRDIDRYDDGTVDARSHRRSNHRARHAPDEKHARRSVKYEQSFLARVTIEEYQYLQKFRRSRLKREFSTDHVSQRSTEHRSSRDNESTGDELRRIAKYESREPSSGTLHARVSRTHHVVDEAPRHVSARREVAYRHSERFHPYQKENPSPQPPLPEETATPRRPPQGTDQASMQFVFKVVETDQLEREPLAFSREHDAKSCVPNHNKTTNEDRPSLTRKYKPSRRLPTIPMTPSTSSEGPSRDQNYARYESPSDDEITASKALLRISRQSTLSPSMSHQSAS